MTLDEAIKHAEEVAEEYETDSVNINFDEDSCLKCAKEHRQLAEWLKELKAYRERDFIIPNIEQMVADMPQPRYGTLVYPDCEGVSYSDRTERLNECKSM